MSKPTADEIERRVRRAGASRLDPRDRSAAADLSSAAIAARRAAGGGGQTGSELIDLAGRVFDAAKRLAKQAQRAPVGRRRQKLSAKADEALMTAAKQIRVAERTPLATRYLHAVTLDQIQTIDAEIARAMTEDAGALAIDTHRRIADQRNRRRAEGIS